MVIHCARRSLLGSLLLAGLTLTLPCVASPDTIIGSRMIVVLEGSQAESDSQKVLEGVDMGIMKSSNAALKDHFEDVHFVFLEVGKGGLFDGAEDFVLPWLQRHLELLAPQVVLSMGGKAASMVENVTANLALHGRPNWHFKCLQPRCPSTGSGLMAHESCVDFEPGASDVLREVGRLKPSVSKVLLLSDGSAVAQHLAVGLHGLSTHDRHRLCRDCIVEEQLVASAADLRSRVPSNEANTTFVILPSIVGLNGTLAEIWAALRSTEAGAFVPEEIVDLGGLASLHMHRGSGAEECSVVIAQTGSMAALPAYENRTTNTYELTMNIVRAQVLEGIDWFNGNLHHSGREIWEPLQLLWSDAALAQSSPKPKVLIVHSYGRNFPLTYGEHNGFIKGLQSSGYLLHCHKAMYSCEGDLEVRTLYWLTKFWFQHSSDIAVTAAHTREYIKRWRPDVVLFSDDDVLNYLVIPCFQPLSRGPNPSYHECAGTQYVGSGINADVRRLFRDTCLEYHLNGTCAGGQLFIEAGSSAACGSCVVGSEPECPQCVDLYNKARPANITLHLEASDMLAVFQIMRSVKPSVRKVVLFSDDTVSSRGWKQTIMRQFNQLRTRQTDTNISIDFDQDWHILSDQNEFLARVQDYQDKPEYMVWMPATLAFLPMDPLVRTEVWQDFLARNTLGEVLSPGESDSALLAAAAHPDSMGRACGQYASLILRGAADASMLPILTTPLSKVFANVGRALQLQEYGILPIPAEVLNRADRIFTLCPPGQRLKQGQCVACPAGTFKDSYGDSVLLCLSCQTADPNETGLTHCPPAQGVSETVWTLGIVLVSLLVCLLLALAWRLRWKANAVWIIKEAELDFGPGPVVILGQGTFGFVVKAEYRGTMVAVKRALPQGSAQKFDWEARTMAFEGGITGSATPTPFAGNGSPTPASKLSDGKSAASSWDLEASNTRSNVGKGILPMPGPSGVMTLRPAPVSLNPLSRKAMFWRQHYRLRKDFIREMRMLSRLRHPCVTTIMGAVMSSSAEPALVMELMDHGSLYNMLHNDTVVIEREMALHILCDVAQGIRFLHAAKPVIVHGDIKAQNVLLDAKFRAKVSDFGLSQKKQVGACGTPYWMAPELLTGGQQSPASDVYAFGILLNEVCSRQDPYAGQDVRLVIVAVVRDFKRPAIPKTCCLDLEVLMKDCWAAKPEIRPPAQELDERLRRMSTSNASPATSPMAILAPPCRALQREFDERCKRTEGLLYDVFPTHVADQLRSGMKVEPESREVVTIFFSDIVGFTNISSTIEPRKISHMLDRLYTKFDALSREHGVFKVETIGDAYMAVSNLAEDQRDDHAKRIALFALAAVEAANQTLIDVDDPSKGYINIRVGFHSGPVVANVVGTRNLRYCLFGDAVNTASRMESNSIKNHIHCSSCAAHILREQAPDVELISRGVISVKGKGEMETFWVSKAPDLPSEAS